MKIIKNTLTTREFADPKWVDELLKENGWYREKTA